MNIKKFFIRVLKIDVTPVYTINLIDYNNSDDSKKASGRTTRLADAYIQLLFTTGSIKVVDHHYSSRVPLYLMDTIIRRLKSEHPGVLFSIKYDTITLVDKKLR